MDWNAPRRIAVFLIAINTLGSPPATRAQQQKDIYDVNFECSQMNGPLTVREAGRGDGLKDYCAGQFYGGGYRGLPKDTSAAKRYYRLSADAGFVAGQLAVGDEYWPGDYVQAMAWYQKAASQNFGTAQWRIGRLYLYGNGVTKNRGEAIKWYRLAAANGSRDAKAYVAKLDAGLDPERQEPAQDLMAEANRVRQSGDQAAAARTFLAAARASNSKAQLQIGWHYENGIGVPQNYNEAASWYRKAADQGEPSAMANLANMYEFGKGVPEDWVQSAKWLQTSATFGDPLGQSRLGDAYQYGIGVPQNRKLAIHWHYEATLRGNGHSASEFARLSKSGTFIGFYNADERALFPGMPTLLIYAEPAGTLFHNSAERRAYMAGAGQQHAAAEAQSARDVGRADYQRRKNEYDQCTGAGGSNCRNPGPPPH